MGRGRNKIKVGRERLLGFVLVIGNHICPLVAAYKAESGDPSTYWTYVEWTDESPPSVSFPLTEKNFENFKKLKINQIVFSPFIIFDIRNKNEKQRDKTHKTHKHTTRNSSNVSQPRDGNFYFPSNDLTMTTREKRWQSFFWVGRRRRDERWQQNNNQTTQKRKWLHKS